MRGKIIVAVFTIGFVAWLGVRVSAAMKEKTRLAAEREQAAAAAAKEKRGAGPAALIEGVPEKWVPRLAFEGTLLPSHEADLGFKAGGRVAAIRVRLGDRVAAGQVLAVLDATEALAQQQAAAAQVRAAEAQLALADDAARRTGNLIGSGSMPQASGVQVSQQRALAAAQLDAAKAQAALAEANLKNHTLAAPFAGSVTRVPPGTGAIVGPGIPLFHLSDLSTFRLAGTLGERDAPLAKPGAAVEVRASDRIVLGRVTSVLSSVDPATRRVPIEAEVKADGTLLGGAFVRATLVGKDAVPVLRFPASVLRPGSQDEVFVVKDARLASRRIAFASTEGALLVRAGIAAGEKVLLAPSAEARDGDKALAP